MPDVIANIAKGRFVHYATLPEANDAFIAIPLETSGLEADAAIVDHDTVAAVLAGSSNEQTSNMTRKTLTGVAVTVDDTNNRVDVDAADWTQTAATGNAISAYLVGYDSDTTGGADSNIVPIVVLAAVATPAGGDITYQVGASGFLRAA